MRKFVAACLLAGSLIAAGCERSAPPPPDAPSAPAKAEPAAPSAVAPQPVVRPAAELPAGIIFGQPVSVANYYFAKRISYMFPYPREEKASPEDRERYIWEALILNFEAFRQGVTATEAQMEERVNLVLQGQQQPFTRSGDPAAYAAWVKATLDEDVPFFENQMRYLLDIDLLKDKMRGTFPVTVTDEEIRQEFLNERHHVGGEMVVFDALEPAKAFYEDVKAPGAWEKMKALKDHTVQPVSLMTLEAYIDLWGIPRDQIYAFHALEIGAVGEPMPFGKQWAVYRLGEKRVADESELPDRKESYRQQLVFKKQYQALQQWIEKLKADAKLIVLPLPAQ